MSEPQAPPPPALPSLAAIEQRAAGGNLLLRLQVRHLLGLRTLRVVVARPRPGEPPLLLGEALFPPPLLLGAALLSTLSRNASAAKKGFAEPFSACSCPVCPTGNNRMYLPVAS